MARGVSTVLDVSVCLLLIGAALATLSAAPPASAPDGPDADAPAQTVATATTGIRIRNDTRHVTLGAHLATGAVTAATVEDRRLLATNYPTRVGNATADALDRRSYVTATWTPYPNASVGGRVAAGTEPPASADVAATTLTVATGIEEPTGSETRSFGGLSDALADAVVAYLFPPRRTRAALMDPRTRPAIVDRYRTAAGALGADVDGAVDTGDVQAANAALSGEFATRFEADLRADYDDPTAATDAVTVENATLVVRRWEP